MRQSSSGYSLFNARNIISLNNQTGIFLIEYMIAVTIGLAILSFIFEVYRGMKIGHGFLDRVNVALSDAETVINLISGEVRIAGRMGCEKISKQHLLFDNSTEQYQAITALSVNRHQIKTIRSQADYSLLMQDAYFQSYLDIHDDHHIHVGDLIMISDCVNSEMARVIALHHLANHILRIQIVNPLHFLYKRGSMISKVITVEIAELQRGNKSFVSLAINGSRSMIAEHVENLSFSKTQTGSISFHFDILIGHVRKRWYGYATNR